MSMSAMYHPEPKERFSIKRDSHDFKPEGYDVMGIGSLHIFPSREQLLQLQSAIRDYLISLEPDEPVARVIANHLMDEANKIVGEDSDAN